MNFIKFPISPVSLSILSGILIGTSTIPFPPWALFFCLCPLMWVWLNETPKKVFWCTGLTFFISSLIGFFWISSLLQNFAGLPKPVSIVILLVFCLFYHASFPILAFVYAKWLRHKSHYPLISLASIFSITWILSPMLFPWDFSINWIYGGLKGYEFMDLMGAQGLHAVTVFINASFLFSFLYLIKNRSFKPLVSTFSFLFFFNVAGYLYSFYAQPKADSTFYATLAQSNIGNVNEAFKTYGMGYKSEIINTYLDLSREALSPKSQLLIWPETAYPQIYKSGFKYHSSTLKTIGFLKQNNVPLLSGIYAYNEKNKRLSNSALFFAADGSFPHPPVKKVHLLAFGEYMPFEKVFPILRKLFPMVGNFEPGPGPQVLDIGGVKLGVQICYESFFTAFSRGLAEKDAQIIVNLTNDSWYGRWSEPKQHLYSLLARSIETRLPIIRATNTGISTVLLPNSKIVEPSSVYTKWSKTYEVPYLLKPKKTFYQRLGFLLTLPLLLSVFILSIVYGKK